MFLLMEIVSLCNEVIVLYKSFGKDFHDPAASLAAKNLLCFLVEIKLCALIFLLR